MRDPTSIENLSKEDKIKKQVLEDFPDGVDLRLGEADYLDFKESYGYRPEVDPEVARAYVNSIQICSNTFPPFFRKF